MSLVTDYIFHWTIVQASQRCQRGPWYEAFRESSVIKHIGDSRERGETLKCAVHGVTHHGY